MQANFSKTIPCHFYHTSHCTKGKYCTFSHEGFSRGYCPGGNCVKCGDEKSDVPCHFYHTSTCTQMCGFSHNGKPQGKCPGKSCHICHAYRNIPCHNYHVAVCIKGDKCEYSHQGDPKGICPVKSCKLCEEVKAKNLIAQKARKPQIQRFSANQQREEQKNEEKNSSKHDSECCICLSEPPKMAFVPCGHVALCEGCHKDYQKKEERCPLCKQDFTAIIKIYQI